MKVKLVKSALAVAFVLFSFAFDSFAWTVSGDYYVVGEPGGSLSSGTGYSGAPSTKYDVATAQKPNWSEIAADTTVAAGSKKLRINGCVILDQIPSGLFADYEILEGSFLILNVESKSVFADGSKLVIPVGAKAQLLPGTWTLDGGKYWLTNGAKSSGGTVVGSTDMEINGEFIETKVDSCWSDLNVLHNFNGKTSGTGTYTISGWGKQIYMSQDFSFGGDMIFNGPYGGCLILASLNVSGKMNSLTMTGNQYSKKDDANYCAESLVFGPPAKLGTADSAALDIGTLSSETAEFSNGHRYGNNLLIYGGRSVHADTFTGNLHVMANRLDQYNTRNWMGSKSLVNYFGTGSISVDEMSANAKLCISTNIFTTVGTMNAGAKIDYTCQSDGVNTMTLDVTGESDATAQVVAPHLAMLPCRLSGFKGQVMLGNTDAKTYAMTINTANGTSAGDYNAVGCVGSGTLAAAPASGTINVTLTGTPQDGEYALARFTSGGELLAGWTVNVLNLENGCYGGRAVSVVKDTTGLWLQVRTSVPPPTPKDEDGYYLFGKTTEQGGGLTTEDSGKVLVAADWPDFVSYD
ncbi:MAG: hypothetical protein KBT68_04515, partial [bacterium]|nr:hypothetical protein [Candidatus Colisoma equi]